MLTVSDPEYIWSKTDIITNPAEKYNHWNQNLDDVINYQGFVSDPNNDEITAWYKTIGGATIQSVLISGGTGGDIEFKDPWYPNGGTLGGIPKNKGMSADWLTFQTVVEIEPTNEDQFKGVFLNQNPQFQPGIPIYSVRAPLTQDIYLSQTGQIHWFYFQNWDTVNADVQYPNSFETPVVFTSSNATVTANLKSTQLSGDAAAFTNNGQRKFVRTQEEEGWLHQVYTSNGHVWLEHSTDDGETWFLGNNGQPLDDGAGKCPSIDWGHYYYYSSSQGTYVHEHILVVAYQQQYMNSYKIQYAIFKKENDIYVNNTPFGTDATLYTESSDPYSTDANPNIALSKSNAGVYDFVISFERKSGSTAGIYWLYGRMDNGGVHPTYKYTGPEHIQGTDGNSVNATVHFNKSITPGSIFYIAYQQGDQNIKDVRLRCAYYGYWMQEQLTQPVTISSSTDLKNYKPSLVQKPNGYDFQVCWIRNKMGDSGAPYWINAVSWESNNSNVYRIYGSWDVRSVSSNVRDDNTTIYTAWSEA